MFYLDTSFVVASLTSETSTKVAQDWLEANQNSDLACSAWVGTEVVSALGLKARSGQITAEKRLEVMRAWVNFRDASMTIFPVAHPCFEKAATFLDHYELGLRAGDALHLAIAASNKLVLVTFDNRMAAAAAYYGIVVDPL
jgi:uncharacterized protein